MQNQTCFSCNTEIVVNSSRTYEFNGNTVIDCECGAQNFIIPDVITAEELFNFHAEQEELLSLPQEFIDSFQPDPVPLPLSAPAVVVAIDPNELLISSSDHEASTPEADGLSSVCTDELNAIGALTELDSRLTSCDFAPKGRRVTEIEIIKFTGPQIVARAPEQILSVNITEDHRYVTQDGVLEESKTCLTLKGQSSFRIKATKYAGLSLEQAAINKNSFVMYFKQGKPGDKKKWRRRRAAASRTPKP